ncbi:hypothetical protein [Candidatus Cyanaurora vandensis]|uniref:hypothetical protein n=1 Tax=Candidatus Cyanaurora vandensis TaxID=2714958 RepID=UPI00257E769B|nr:hypothetical protein [Candidatus Cyanaurora vandensis]
MLQLDDAAYEAALVAYETGGLTPAFIAAEAVYLNADHPLAEAQENARLTCAVIEGDTAYENYLQAYSRIQDGTQREVLHRYAEREARYTRANFRLG